MTESTFDQWIDTLTEDVVQDEYGYEPGEFAIYPECWRTLYDEGLTPSQAFARACAAATLARREEDAARTANWARIQAEDAALITAWRTTP